MAMTIVDDDDCDDDDDDRDRIFLSPHAATTRDAWATLCGVEHQLPLQREVSTASSVKSKHSVRRIS